MSTHINRFVCRIAGARHLPPDRIDNANNQNANTSEEIIVQGLESFFFFFGASSVLSSQSTNLCQLAQSNFPALPRRNFFGQIIKFARVAAKKW